MKQEKLEELRELLVKETCGCSAQHTGWPCNTCFHAMNLENLKHDIHDYWEAVLAERGDYPEIPKNPELIIELLKALGGTV